jgi:hypothetical protein
VNEWLASVFQGDHVPYFERTPHTRDTLFNMFQWQQLKLFQKQHIAKAVQMHNKEYAAEGGHVELIIFMV